MKKNKTIAGLLIVLVVIIVIFLTAWVFSDDLINVKFKNFITPADAPIEQIKSNEQLINELKDIYTNKISTENSLNKNMVAIWLDIDNDFSYLNEKSIDDAKIQISSDFAYYRNFIPNTFFVKPTNEDKIALFENDGSKFDVIGNILGYVDYLDCDAFLVLDELFFTNGELDISLLNKYLVYNFKGILLSIDNEDTTVLYDSIVKLSNYINNNYSELFLGIEIKCQKDNFIADKNIETIFQQKLLDFGYLDIDFSTLTQPNTFESISVYWNTFAEFYNVPFYSEQRCDKLVSNLSENGTNQVKENIKSLYELINFDGYCFYSGNILKNNYNLARDIAIFLNDVSGNNQKKFSVNELTINPETDTVQFTGLINNDKALFCSDNYVKTQDGKFIYEQKLDKWLNVFDFNSGGGQFVYKIINNIELIKEVYPNTDFNLDENNSIEVFAVSPTSSEVLAIINGNVYNMLPNSNNSSFNIPEGYSLYSTVISLSNTEIKSAELSFFCYYDNMTDMVSCSKIAGYTFDDSVILPIVSNTNNKLTPYQDHGLGKSLMCIVDFDNCEQISTPDDYDTYHPYKSQLLKGTIDYIKNISVTKEGYLVYELNSGINVYGVDAILINDGYNLPLNDIVIKECDYSDSQYTRFVFNSNWLTPITVSPEKQNYEVGYQQFSYNITNFNSNYIDITFHYSKSISGDSLINFTQNSVFNKYELYTGSNDTIILRLYLTQPGKFYGFYLKENANGDVEILFRNKLNNSLGGKTVMLDPGHGGLSMVGTALNDNSVSEAEITLPIALYTKQYLESKGAKVLLTRNINMSLSLFERTVICENANPDIFVSIHCDGSDNLNESGTHTFYYTPFSQLLASNIHNSLVNAYCTNIYSEADANYSKVNKKIKYYPFYVTRGHNCPSVLIETGFLTNYTEGYVLANPYNQQIIGEAIGKGIENYFSQY